MASRTLGTVVIFSGIAILTVVGLSVPWHRSAREPALVERSIETGPVEHLTVNGLWTVRIVSSADDGVRVDLPSGDSASDAVRYDNGELILSGNGLRARREAVIAAPNLHRVEINGAARITLDGISTDALDIEVDGTGSIEASEARIGRLEVRSDGAARIDLADAVVHDANLEVDGAARIDLTMDGGVLSGEIDGAARVRYDGTVSSQTVNIDGLGRVEGPGN